MQGITAHIAAKSNFFPCQIPDNYFFDHFKFRVLN